MPNLRAIETFVKALEGGSIAAGNAAIDRAPGQTLRKPLKA